MNYSLNKKVKNTINYLATTEGKKELEKLQKTYAPDIAIARVIVAHNRIYKWENICFVRDKILDYWKEREA